MSLYQKYRPQEFDSLSGQQAIKKTLQNALKKDLIAHAYLFCGPRGTGKTTTARLIAKSLNCPNFNKDTAEPCNQCEICTSITESSLIDVIEIDAASNRGIDEIRELKETIKFAPTLTKNKIYIVDEVHMLTNEAFNALLKTLEEPPTNVFFILATTEVHKVPETIISRCQRFDFKRISEIDVINRLKYICETEKIDFENDALELISLYADGGLRDAISVLDQISVTGKVSVTSTKEILGSTGIDTLQKFLNSLIGKNETIAFEIIQDLHNQGADIKQFQIEILKLARHKLHTAITNNDQSLKELMLNLIELWQEINNTFKNSIIKELPLEVLTVKFCNEFNPNTNTNPNLNTQVNSNQKITTNKNINTETPVIKTNKIIENKRPANKNNSAQNTYISEPINESIQKQEHLSTETTIKDKAEPENNSSLNFDVIKNWKHVIDKISVPTLRISLKNVKVVLNEQESGTVNLVVSSNFEYDNLKKSENIKLIEDAIFELSEQKYIVSLQKEIVQYRKLENPIKNTSDNYNSANQNSYTKETASKTPANNLPVSNYGISDYAIDMFEGEVIE